MTFKRGVFNSLTISIAILSLTDTRSASEDSPSPVSSTPSAVSQALLQPVSVALADPLRPILVGVKGHLIQLFVVPGQRVQAGQLVAKVSEEVAGSSQYTVIFVVAPADGIIAETNLKNGDFHHAETVLARLRSDKPASKPKP